MSQPHPPIPEPQPQVPPPAEPPFESPPQPPFQPHPGSSAGPEDDPRTQSILLPPSQRQSEPAVAQPPVDQPPVEQPAPWAPPAEHAAGGPAAPPTGPITAQPAGGASFGTQVTAPVDFVPGLGADGPPVTTTGSSAAPPSGPPTLSGGPGTSPGMPASTPRRSPLAGIREQAGRGGAALLTLALGVLGLALLQVGLALDFGTQSLWDVVPTWSVFATLAAVVVIAPALAGLAGRGLPARTAWRVGAAGLVALAVFWVLVALPVAASDRGFWLTAALAAAGVATWLAPGRPE